MNQYSRRIFIRDTLQNGWLLAGAGLLTACGAGRQSPEESKENPDSLKVPKPAAASSVAPCEDFSAVEKAEIEKRQALGYTNVSPIPDSQCSNCKLWIPPAGGASCGGCMLFKGPVYPDAYCTYWAPLDE